MLEVKTKPNVLCKSRPNSWLSYNCDNPCGLLMHLHVIYKREITKKHSKMFCVINNPVLTAAVQLLFGEWVGSDCTESLWYLFPLLVGWKIGGNDENRKEIKNVVSSV